MNKIHVIPLVLGGVLLLLLLLTLLRFFYEQPRGSTAQTTCTAPLITEKIPVNAEIITALEPENE